MNLVLKVETVVADIRSAGSLLYSRGPQYMNASSAALDLILGSNLHLEVHWLMI